MDWIYDMVKTWGHFFVGLSVLAIAFLVSRKADEWRKDLKEQFDRDKKLSQKPQPWRYQ